MSQTAEPGAPDRAGAADTPPTAHTPHAGNHAGLGPLDSRPVDVDGLPWQPTRYPGIEIKILLDDPASGLRTALFRWQAGALLPFHEHVDIEQTLVLEGSFEDQAGVVTAGNFIWRPAHSRHQAWSRDGALIFSVFLKPNRFFDAEPEHDGDPSHHTAPPAPAADNSTAPAAPAADRNG